jgi:hypothetical protein
MLLWRAWKLLFALLVEMPSALCSLAGGGDTRAALYTQEHQQ